jgi:hypothetical protein
MSKRPPKPKLSSARQFLALQHSKLDGFEGHLRPHGWVAAFNLQPSPVSRTYRVRLDFADAHPPRVYVLEPDIFLLAAERRPPHLYPPFEYPAHLCLFHPDKRDWTRQMLVSETIVPWASEWLFYFELWLVTKEWMGGGEHPSARSSATYGARLEQHWREKRLNAMRGTK